MRLKSIGRLWRTVRPLRWAQIFGRFRFRYLRPRLSMDLKVCSLRTSPEGQWMLLADRACRRVGETKWQFLNQTFDLSETGWDSVECSKLWRYNLHYFDALTREQPSGWRGAAAESFIGQWIEQNPAPHGTAWEPYPTSLRLVNWSKWLLAGNRLIPEMLPSMNLQARWLRRRLEFHLLGNHLWANGKALVFVGVLLDCEEASDWLETGLGILTAELQEQFLADGGHFERSPMYHAILLEDLIDLLQLASLFPDAGLDSLVVFIKKLLPKAFHWLKVMTHPDGRIAFFNDACFGVAPDYADLREYAAEVGIAPDETPLREAELLEATGYARLQIGAAVLICDVGDIGPEYLPGHAHADTLSFEFSLHGRRLFVNGGVSTYDVCPERLRQRGTVAKNAVCVGGKDSSEVWSSFRVGRRARIRSLKMTTTTNALTLEASHDGYAFGSKPALHRRVWVLSDSALEIEDSLGSSALEARAHFHLHPSVSGGQQDMQTISLMQEDQRILLRVDGAATLQQGSWHPEFNRSVDGVDITAKFNGTTSKAWISWGQPVAE